MRSNSGASISTSNAETAGAAAALVRIRRVHIVNAAFGALLGHGVIPVEKRPARIDHGENILDGSLNGVRIAEDGNQRAVGAPLRPRTAGAGNADDAPDVRRLGKGAVDAPDEGPVFAQEKDFLFLYHAWMGYRPCNDVALPCNMDRHYKPGSWSRP